MAEKTNNGGEQPSFFAFSEKWIEKSRGDAHETEHEKEGKKLVNKGNF